MRVSATHNAGWLMLALACAFAPSVALAQNSTNAAYASASPPSNPTDAPAAPADGTPLPDESSVLSHALMLDPYSISSAAPAKTLRLPSQTIQHGLDIKTTEKPDGSGTLVLKQPLPYDANVGADLGLASSAPEMYRPNRPLPGSRNERSSGAAWASVGVLPNLATVDARVDPSNDQGKLGTTFKHSMPVGRNFSVTLQNSYSVTESFSAPTAAPSDLPLMATPANSAAQSTPQALSQALSQVWGNEKVAKFDILPTGTTFGAKLASTSTDPVTHNTLSAEQKLYGPLRVTTAVTDAGQPTRSKSISAGFKLNW